MGYKLKLVIGLISGLGLLTLIFQNCSKALSSGASATTVESSTFEAAEKNTVNYNCMDESNPSSTLGKYLEIPSGHVMYCEMESTNLEIGLNSLNLVTGKYDHQPAFSIAEMKSIVGFASGKMKSGRNGLIYRWRTDFTSLQKYRSIVHLNPTSATEIDGVEVKFLPPEAINLGCKIQGSNAALSKSISARSGETIYCELDNYSGMTAYSQNLDTLQYSSSAPLPIADFTWRPGKKLSSENGYIYSYTVEARTGIYRSRGFFFLDLKDGNVISDYVDITFTP